MVECVPNLPLSNVYTILVIQNCLSFKCQLTHIAMLNGAKQQLPYVPYINPYELIHFNQVIEIPS